MLISSGTTGTIGIYLQKSVSSFDYRDFVNSEFVQPIKKSSTFIHLAGIVGEKRVNEDLKKSYEVNVEKTIILASRLLETGINRFIYVSSSHVYQKSEKRLTENDTTGPISQYASQKLAAERGLCEVFKSSPEKLSILRVFSVLRWGGHPGSLGHQIKNAATDPKISIKNVDDVRDFLHPKQIAQVILKVASLNDLPAILNICSGNGLSVREAAQKLSTSRDLSIQENQLIPGKSESFHIVGDNSRLLKILNINSISFSYE